MNFDDYREYATAETLMGPNSARILGELLQKHPLKLKRDSVILDLGCGKGLTSFILAKETGAKVYANDLWISADDNQKRFTAWGVSEQITPVCEDAQNLSFEKNCFDALVSVDSYHYFATGSGFFEKSILPFLKDNADVLIGIPGIKDEYSGRSEELLAEWLRNEAYMFKSISEWKEIIGSSNRIKMIETWEMECFDLAWNDWLATGNEYALGDKEYFEALIKPLTCFVGICIKLK